MNLCRPFIQRPVATWLLMAAIVLSGILGYRLLPRAPLPEVDYPTLQVVVSYPGASPELMTSAVVAPLERNFGAMPGLLEMSSTSAAGMSVINLRFGLDIELDSAEQSVQAAINAAANLLPPELPSPPIYSKVNAADAPVVTLAISSESLALTDVQDWVETRLVQRLSQIVGVGRVSTSGGQRPAIRVEVDAAAASARGVGLDRLHATIAAANSNQAKGSLEGYGRSYALEANSQLQSVEQYRDLVIAQVNGAPLRLGEVATISRAAEDTNLAAWANGKHAILVSVQRQPGANVIEVVDEIRRILPDLMDTSASPIDISLQSDRTVTIRSSVEGTEFELLLAIALVVMVIFMFLRTFSGTLIPSLAVPVSLVGTFGIMYLAGFSINNLTLMALTIATGFVVDDAIVMIENISRYIEEGHSPLQAALEGSKQIGFTIISLTFSLLAVLIPLLFMGDVVGRLFREFAITLAVAILISAAISLSFTPMLCARLLGGPRPQVAPETHPRLGILARVIAAYGIALDWLLPRRTLAMAGVLATFVATAALAVRVPKGFFPEQDTGIISAITEGAPGTSFKALSERQRALAEVVARDPAVRNVSSVIGIDGTNLASNTGRLLIELRPHQERRGESASLVAKRLMNATESVSGISMYAQAVQDLRIDDRMARGQYQYVLASPDPEQLLEAAPRLKEQLELLPEIATVFNNAESGGHTVVVQVDRDRAARLGVNMAAVNTALYDAFGQRFISTIFTQSNQYRVVLGLERDDTRGVAELERVWVTGDQGRQVPLSSVAKLEERYGRLAVHREQQFEAATLSFNLAPGFSLGQAVESIERTRAALHLPSSITAQFQGAALAFREAPANELFLIVAALVTMYIVLGILYESFVHPITVLSTLPSAGIGALLALLVTDTELTVIAIIGIVLLIGIVQKNAIMIIDFSLELQRGGKPPWDAVREACLLRFRPILMTTLAALFSAIPLVVGAGPGSELRRPLGVVMIGGLLLSQVLTLFTTPVVFLALDRVSQWLSTRKLPPAEPGDVLEGRRA